MKHDAIYARYSSHMQDDGTSIDVQIEQCERAAGAKCQHYIDRARTGRSIGGRPELERLMAEAEAGKIKRLFVYKFDRIGRSGATHAIVEDLDGYGVEVISATEGKDALARGVQLVVGEHYSRQLAERIKHALVKRFEQGAWTGGRIPFGYVAAERDGMAVLKVDPRQAAIVRQMADWYINESVGLQSIARRLNERGDLRPNGGRWNTTNVYNAMMNPIIRGRPRYNARKATLNRKSGRRRLNLRPAGEFMERRDESLRILDDATFAMLRQQAARASTRTSTRTGRGIAPFTGLLTCAGCGGSCHRVVSRPGKVYYICAGHLRQRNCPEPAHVREDKLAALVQTKLGGVLGRADIATRAVAGAVAALKDDANEAREQALELARLDQRQRALVMRLADGDIASAAKLAISRELASLEERRNGIEHAMDQRDTSKSDADDLAVIVQQLLQRARECLEAVTTPERFNRIVERLIGPMVIDQKGRVRCGKAEKSATDTVAHASSIL